MLDEIDQQNNEMNAPPSFNPANSGQYGYGPGYNWYGDNYISPWDIFYRNKPFPGLGILQPWYFITNGNVDDPTPYDIKVYSYVGLAYFDGDNDGVFKDPASGVSIPMAQSLGGNFPNLFGGNAAIPGQEVGKLVRVTNSFDLRAYPHPTSSKRIEDKLYHLANGNNPRYPNLPGANESFIFGNLTTDERALLYDYGKVFFYEVEVYHKNTNILVLSTLMHPYIETLPNRPDPSKLDTGWKPVKDLGGNDLYGEMPNGVSVPLHFYYTNLPNGTDWDISNPYNANLCDSREVVFEVPNDMPYEVDIDGTYKLTLGFFASGQTGWVNSALYLNLGSH